MDDNDLDRDCVCANCYRSMTLRDADRDFICGRCGQRAWECSDCETRSRNPIQKCANCNIQEESDSILEAHQDEEDWGDAPEPAGPSGTEPPE